jgi:hypothetical protein
LAAALVLMMGAAPALLAQSAESGASGSIAGKLTDLRSAPVGGAVVVARNEATGAEARTTTKKNGTYGFTGLEAGVYTVEAVSEQLGRGRLEGILVATGHESRVRTAMEFEPLLAAPIQAASIKAVFHEIEPERPALSMTLAVEPLRQLAVSARSLPEFARETPAIVTPVATATLAAEPLQTLPLPGWQTAEVKPGVAGGLSAVSATAVGAAQTAIKAGRPQPTKPIPIQTASQKGDPVAPAVTTTMSAAEVQALPASGRRWQDFVLDTPTASTAAGGASQTSLRGAGQEAVENTVDGAQTEPAFNGTSRAARSPLGAGSYGQSRMEPDGMGQAWASGHRLIMSESAIREVQTVAGNVESSANRAAGGSTNVETWRGGNNLHGQGFLFDRQNTWGAQNPFAQWVKETAPAAYGTVPLFTSESYTPPDHETTWGIGIGSRIRRDNLFWFAALDSNRRNAPGLSMVKHPYLCANVQCTQQTGFFAQPSDDQMQVLAARLGLSSVNPVAEGLTAYSPMLETLAGLLGPAPRTAVQWTGFGRIDWMASERQSLILEGMGAQWDSPGGGLTRVAETYGNHSFGETRASEEWLLGRWGAFLTPNLLATARVSAEHILQEELPGTPSTFEKGFLAGNAWGQLPQIVVDNRYGFTIGNPSRFGLGSYPDEHIYQGHESLDWAHGKLLARAGFDVSHNADAITLLNNQTGRYTYSNVENFVSDALVFAKYGPTNALDPNNQHNCDQTGRVWRDSGGELRGLGNLPCYSYYSQTIGPSGWHLSTNDWSGYATAQWQASKLLVLSAGLRWEREQLPKPIALLDNPALPLTERMPNLGNDWGPRVSMALGSGMGYWPVLRLGYGMYFGRTDNFMIETALTQTGSFNGDLNFFLRPTDDLPNNGGGAPPFPYVPRIAPDSVVEPGAVEFAPRFHNPEVHQAVVAVEESLPGHIEVTASAMLSLGRRLPVFINTNFDPAVNPGTITYAVVDSTGAGPIKATQITAPFYASLPSADCRSGSQLNFAGQCGWFNPNYQQIVQITSKANSTYEAAMLRVARYGRHGLSLHAHYTYAHTMDWNPGESPLDPDPAKFNQEYGTSRLDVRHTAAAMVIYEPPWKLRNLAGRLGNGWMLSGIALFRSGLPYTMRSSGSLAKEFTDTGEMIVGLEPGMNASGGDNRIYGIGRNTYRYPYTWKADLRIGKHFDLGHMRQLELLAESFNLFNHQNVTEMETTGYYIESGTASGALPTLNFLTGPLTEAGGAIKKVNSTAFGQPLSINGTNFYRERQIQVGLRMRF